MDIGLAFEYIHIVLSGGLDLREAEDIGGYRDGWPEIDVRCFKGVSFLEPCSCLLRLL